MPERQDLLAIAVSVWEPPASFHKVAVRDEHRYRIRLGSITTRHPGKLIRNGFSIDPSTPTLRLIALDFVSSHPQSNSDRLEDGSHRDNAYHLQPQPDSRPRPASTRLTETPPSRSQSQNHTDSDYRPYEQPHLHQLDIDAHLDPGAHPPESDHNNKNNSNLETFAHDGFLLSENQRAMRYDPEVLGILEEVEIRWLFDQ
jgi:hypothetical protein